MDEIIEVTEIVLSPNNMKHGKCFSLYWMKEASHLFPKGQKAGVLKEQYILSLLRQHTLF